MIETPTAAARKALNMTQEELAAAVGVTQPAVHAYERGFYNPSEKVSAKIRALLIEKGIKVWE